jgi:16S rRNA (adenine1518-N6/adenine1519-N6)-dimethyltransferase
VTDSPRRGRKRDSTADSDRRRHAPKKSLGQNFLVDPNTQRAIANAILPGPEDELLEIGPGRGALTQHLAGRVRRLILVELDDHLAASLAERFAGDPSVSVLHADFLDVDLDTVTASVDELKVIGNIPYNITSPIIFRLLERRPRPREIVLMVQREVADRILADAGGKSYGALAVGVRLVADVERVMNVGRGAFRPAPDVDSTVIRILPHHPPRFTPEVEAAVRAVTRTTFGQRRKQLRRILRDAYQLTPDTIDEIADEVGFDPRDRPETLAPEGFVRLARALLTHSRGG